MVDCNILEIYFFAIVGEDMRATLVLFTMLTLYGCTDYKGDETETQRIQLLKEVAESAVGNGLPGVVIIVSEPDGELYSAVAGVANRAAEIPMSPDSLIHAASTTKAITAAAVLILLDRGELSIGDKLPRLLPEEVIQDIPYASEISVEHLLLHTSGLYSPNNNPEYLARYIGSERKERAFWTPEEIIAFAADPENPPVFQPGEGSHYSDINYVLLSVIVSAVSDMPFKSFVQQEIFDVIGMQNSYFLSDYPDRKRARGYTVDSRILREIGLDPGLVPDEFGLVDTTEAQEKSDGAAGIITTATDLARFALAFTQGELLSENSREFVLKVANRVDEGAESEVLGVLRGHDFGYGTVVTAEGDGPGITVMWVLHIDTGRIVAAATNLFGRWDESEYLLMTVVPSALRAVSGEQRK